MITLLFLAAALLIVAAIVVFAMRRPPGAADVPAVRPAEPVAQDTGRRIEEAMKGATPYVPEAMRDTESRAGGLRAASENPGQSLPDDDRPASDPR